MVLYKITNIVSGSIYIGITKSTSTKRFYSHKSCAKRGIKNKLYDAMRSYGVENFKVEDIKTFDNREDLEEAEYNKIKELRDAGENLYNILDGGTSYFPIKDKKSWRKKLSIKRKGKKPALGMKHTDKNKKIFSKVSKEYWSTQDTYDKEEVVKYSFKEAKRLFGISKTHYYRLKKYVFS